MKALACFAGDFVLLVVCLAVVPIFLLLELGEKPMNFYRCLNCKATMVCKDKPVECIKCRYGSAYLRFEQKV